MMQEHTQEKIAVYKEYLIRYLSVMCNQEYWDIIAVWEPFAGEGIYGNREKGSAMVAAETIKQFREKEKEKEKGILLFLNEQDPIKWHRLKESMEDYSDFVGIFNGDAEIFLDEISKFLSKSRKTHSLIFIDPYGYTQYTKDNLASLFNLGRIDYLIFMPTSHIYRFRSIEGKAARRFALDLGVSENTLSETGYDTFPDELLACLKKIAKSDFGYSYKLKSTSSTHHLFFITKNITGAIKFLEAKNKIKSKLENNLQITLFDFDSNKIEGDLFELLREPITNTKLLEEIVKKGYLSKDITPVLKKMENEEKLEVSPIPSDLKRIKGSFYLTDKIDKIKICLKHE